MLDDEVIDFFRTRAEALGAVYQTMINTALRAVVAEAASIAADDKPVTVATVATLRQVLREKLHTS